MSDKNDRDVEKVYSTSEFVSKLRRLADALEAGERFEIQVAGERIYVPVRTEFNVEHEREGNNVRSNSSLNGPINDLLHRLSSCNPRSMFLVMSLPLSWAIQEEIAPFQELF